MPTNYQRGVAVENRLVRELRAAGFVASRSAGSHGSWDVIGLRSNVLVLAQVKIVSTGTTEAHAASLAQELIDLKTPPRAVRLLCTWRTGKGWQEIIELTNTGLGFVLGSSIQEYLTKLAATHTST